MTGLSRLPCRWQSLPAKTLGGFDAAMCAGIPSQPPRLRECPPPVTDATVAVEGTSGATDADVTDVAAGLVDMS